MQTNRYLNRTFIVICFLCGYSLFFSSAMDDYVKIIEQNQERRLAKQDEKNKKKLFHNNHFLNLDLRRKIDAAKQKNKSGLESFRNKQQDINRMLDTARYKSENIRIKSKIFFEKQASLQRTQRQEMEDLRRRFQQMARRNSSFFK